MEITQTLEWTPEDVEKWATFLNSPTGKRLLPKALEALPILLANGDTNSILIRNGEVRGWQGLANQLLFLTSVQSSPNAPNSPASSPNFPPLEDDSAWKGFGGAASEPINT